MYIRVYNEKLVYVYEEEDLKNSEIIGKIKGRFALGLSVRENNEFIYYDMGVITSKELQLIIRKRDVVTIAIEMTEDETFDYFYQIAYKLYEEDNSCCEEDKISECLKKKIDTGIVHSSVFSDIKSKIVLKLQENLTDPSLDSLEEEEKS